MGACCCKKRKTQNTQEPPSEDPTQKNNDLEENLCDPNSVSRDSSNISDTIKVSQELPTTETKTEKINEINNENEKVESIKIEKEPKTSMPYESYLKDYLDENIDDTEVFDKKWYNNLEKDKIIYSKRSIIAMLNKAFDPNNKQFKETYGKHPLFISIKSDGSFISDEFQVTKSLYIASKSELPKNTSIKMLSRYMVNTKERNGWDQQIKEYSIIEGSEEGKEVKCVLHNWMKSPMFLVSERDIIEKRYDFFYKGAFFNFESSVNEDYYHLEEGVTRIIDIICIQEIHEENDNFIFRNITQMDAKVSLPQAIINTTLSGKLTTFYKGIIDAINRDYNEGKLVFEDNDGNIIENNNNNNNNNIDINIASN
jgi:hypothetical protein